MTTFDWSEPSIEMPTRLPSFRPTPIEWAKEQLLLAKIRGQMSGPESIAALYAEANAARRGKYADCEIKRNKAGRWSVDVVYDDEAIPANLHVPAFMLLLREGLDKIYADRLAAGMVQDRIAVDRRLARLSGQLLNFWYCLYTEIKEGLGT